MSCISTWFWCVICLRTTHKRPHMQTHTYTHTPAEERYLVLLTSCFSLWTGFSSLRQLDTCFQCWACLFQSFCCNFYNWNLQWLILYSYFTWLLKWMGSYASTTFFKPTCLTKLTHLSCSGRHHLSSNILWSVSVWLCFLQVLEISSVCHVTAFRVWSSTLRLKILTFFKVRHHKLSLTATENVFPILKPAVLHVFLDCGKLHYMIS